MKMYKFCNNQLLLFTTNDLLKNLNINVLIISPACVKSLGSQETFI